MMKRLSKRLAALGAVMLLAGAVLAVAGYAAGAETTLAVNWFGLPVRMGLALRETASDVIEEATYVGGDRRVTDWELTPFKNLEIDVAMGEVQIVADADRYGLDLTWAEPGYELRYENTGGTLRVWNEPVLDLAVDLSGRAGAQVTVYLPKDAGLERLDVKNALGSTMLYGLSARELTVKADMGDVTLVGVKAGDLDLTLDLGDLVLEDVAAATAKAELNMGQFTGTGLEISQSLTADCALGNMDLSGSLRGQTGLTDNMGDVRVTLCERESDYAWDLKTNMGTVRVNGEDQGSRSSRQGGKYRLEVKNSMGDVEVSFE